MNAFGIAAREWAQGRGLEPLALTVCDADAFADAVAHVIACRERGEARSALALVAPARQRLFPTVRANLFAEGMAPDVAAQRIWAFGAGNVQVNGKVQNLVEAEMSAAAAIAFRDLSLAADTMLFRSHYERELAVMQYGARPSRVALYAPRDRSVPLANGDEAVAQPHLVVWAQGADNALVDAVLVGLNDLRTPIVLVGGARSRGIRSIPADRAQAYLRGARAVVCVNDDPSTAAALAAFERPLCCASPAALEVVAHAQIFDPLLPSTVADAVQRSMQMPAPIVLPEAALRAECPQPGPRIQVKDAAPKVTVVLTVWDRVAHLRQNLRSLQRQTYPNVEYIVVSNAGPRCDWVGKEFPNATYFHREENSGTPLAPRNDGIRAATGEFVTCLDDDDVFFPDHIASMVEALSGGALAAYSDFFVRIVQPSADGNDRVLGWDLEKPFGITADDLLVMNRLGYMTVFARRSLYERVGLYDLSVEAGEEVELWMRMMRETDFVHVDRPTAAYTIRTTWEGQLTAESHQKFAGGYEILYRRYPAIEYATIAQQRKQYLDYLRASDAPAPRVPRYPAA